MLDAVAHWAKILAVERAILAHIVPSLVRDPGARFGRPLVIKNNNSDRIAYGGHTSHKAVSGQLP